MIPPELKAICSRFRRSLKTALVQLGTSRLLTFVLVTMAALILLDWWLRFGVAGRITAFVGLLLVVGTSIYFELVRPLIVRWSDTQVLEYLDGTIPEGHDALINLAELADLSQIPQAATELGRSFAQVAREELEPLLKQVRPARAIRRQSVARWTGIALAVVLVSSIGFGLALPHSLTGLQRLLLPVYDINWPQQTELALLEPSPDMPKDGWVCPRGESFSFKVQAGGKVIPREITLSYRGERTRRWLSENLKVETDRTASYTFPDLLKPLEFELRANDARTPRFKIQVVERPALAKIEAFYYYPIYTRVAPKRVESGVVSGLEGTRVLLKFSANQELSAAELVFTLESEAGASDPEAATIQKVPMQLSAAKKDFRHDFYLTTSGAYEVHLQGLTGLAQAEPERYRIQVTQDEPPTAEILEPLADRIATPQGKGDIVFQASDDFGLSQVELRYQMSGGEPQVLSDRITGPVAQQGKHSQAKFTWDFESITAKPGDRMVFYVWVKDCNPAGDGIAESARRQVTFLTPTEFQMEIVLESKALLTEAKLAYEQQKFAYIDFGHWLAGTSPKPDEAVESPALLEQAQIGQEYVGRAAGALADLIQDLRGHIEASAMHVDFMSRRLDQATKFLYPMLETHLPDIESTLAEGKPTSSAEAEPAAALAKMQQAVTAARPKQRQACLTFYRIYTYLADWHDLQTMLVKTKWLAERESEIYDATFAVTPKFIGREIEDLDEEDVKELATIGHQQQAAFEAERALEYELAQLIVKSEREKRLAVWEALVQTFKGLKSYLVNHKLRQAALAIADNRPHTILEAQKLAIKGLTWVRDGLVKAGNDLPSEESFPETRVALILEDDRLKLPAEKMVLAEVPPDWNFEDIVPPELGEEEEAETLEYALQLWHEKQEKIYDRTQHISHNVELKERSPRYMKLKMGMLGLDNTELDNLIKTALTRAADHDCKWLAPRLAELVDESRQSITLTMSGRIGPAVQRGQLGVVESLKDVRRFLAERTQMLTQQSDRLASEGKDVFDRPYVLVGDHHARSLNMLQSLHWALSLERDASRKLAEAPPSAPASERQLYEADFANASRLLARMVQRVTTVTGTVKEFTDEEVKDRLRQWSQEYLTAITPPEVPEEPDVILQNRLARLERDLRQAISALADLADERVYVEIPIPEEDRIPTELVAARELSPEEMENVEMIAEARRELGKFETPEAMIERIQASETIPEGFKTKLIEALGRPFDPKYEDLVTAYFNAITRQSQ